MTPTIHPCPCCGGECYSDSLTVFQCTGPDECWPVHCTVCEYRSHNLATHNRTSQAVELVRKMAVEPDYPCVHEEEPDPDGCLFCYARAVMKPS